ncbi:hypothetical protein HUT16_13065 [Kitasatospora sp. NA04385]|uniref:hypothetical protein n=1 Tax=Kitasatospora sp. NA04385 TaxID=2742135 RepID=UPI0015915152|nr:hypothetical protein [Kitasatospora sp. NA04385]QKW19864.1 hypothetical protein HUT16_13065 [Kitasatospora sp. NA04385]
MRTNRLLAVTVLSVLGVTGLTACNSDEGDAAPAASAPAATSASASASASPVAKGGGLEKLPVEDILKKTQAVGAKLTSVKLTAKADAPEGKMDAVVSADSAGNCAGTLVIEGQGKAEILRTSEKVWVKPDAAFLKTLFPQNAAAAAKVGGKWLVSTKTDEVSGLGEFCDTALEAQKEVGKEETGTVSGTGTVGGVQAVLLKLKSADGEDIEAAVANEGEPYLLSAKTSDSGEMQFSDFDKPVKVTPPAADQVLDFGTLLAS